MVQHDLAKPHNVNRILTTSRLQNSCVRNKLRSKYNPHSAVVTSQFHPEYRDLEVAADPRVSCLRHSEVLSCYCTKESTSIFSKFFIYIQEKNWISCVIFCISKDPSPKTHEFLHLHRIQTVVAHTIILISPSLLFDDTPQCVSNMI